ncbi:MAG TPA: ribonuclease HII [Oscillospiraceae bacterium]|nr:ribonuclease HII [Oscillospiraceae bacterium]
MEFTYENEAYNKGYKSVCGVDEAGRGPLAGAVFAAAVILPHGYTHEVLNDSKKLSEKKREQVYADIIKDAVAFSIAQASQKEIDELNILNATHLAMKRAVLGLNIKADFAYIDGNSLPKIDIAAQCIVKGDSKCVSIAAASVLAKVSRDRYMLELALKYPEYLFEKHKGYGTKLHYAKIRENGISPVHRKTFLRKFIKGEN